MWDMEEIRENRMNEQLSGALRHQRISWILLLGLLFLRIPLIAILKYFYVELDWIDAIVRIGTYSLTVFMIWWEIDHLAEFHIDTFVIMIVILFGPIQTLIWSYWKLTRLLVFPNIPSLIIWLISIVFAFVLWKDRSRVPRLKPASLKWFFIGTLVGLVASSVLSFPFSFQILSEQVSYGGSVKAVLVDILADIPLDFVNQIGYAAVIEEPLFRGFLWGHLKKLEWHEKWIWLFQAGLFTLGHFYYINTDPILFWMIIPVNALVFGWLAWRSRTLASSMAAHGIINSTGYSFGYLVALFRLG